MTQLQLLLIAGDMDDEYRAALDGLKAQLLDGLHAAKIDPAIATLQLGSTPFEDPEYSPLFDRSWSYLLIAPGRDSHNPGEWRWLIEKLHALSKSPVAVVLLTDWIVGPENLQLAGEFDRQVGFRDEADESTPPSGDDVAQTAKAIIELVQADRSSTEVLLPGIPLDTAATAAAPRPQPRSVAELIETRARAAVEPAGSAESAGSLDALERAVSRTRYLRTQPGDGDLRDILAELKSLAGEASRSTERPAPRPAPDQAYVESSEPEPTRAPDWGSVPAAARRAPRESEPDSEAEIWMEIKADASLSSRVARWLLLAGSIGAISAATIFLYRRDLSALIAPMINPVVKLFGSALPPIPAVEPPPAVIADTDNVELAAFAPAACEAGDTLLVQALLHLPADRDAAQVMAIAADPSATRKASKTLSIALRRGETLEIDLEAEGCRIDEVRQSATWRGEPAAVQFFVTVPAERRKPIPMRITAMRAGVPIGAVRFTVPVEAGAKPGPIELQGEHAKRFERAFVSYAAPDRVAVLGYAQALHLAGIEVFQDVLSLEPGDRWEQQLYIEIDRSDLFVLFWSKAASESKWVLAEAEYALRVAAQSASRDPTIRPFLLEGPPIPALPATLKAIHFNDKFRYMILGAIAEAEARRSRPS